MKDLTCPACVEGIANPISHKAGCKYGDEYRRAHEHVLVAADKTRATFAAADVTRREQQRDLDITYCLDGQSVDIDTMNLLKRVWNRAYANGQWRGIDDLKANLDKAVGQTMSEAPR